MGFPEAGKAARVIAAEFAGIDINLQDDVLVNLTNAWKAVGSPKNKEPKFWKRIDSTGEFIGILEEKLKVRQDHLFKTVPGRKRGTYAHWQIFLGLLG